MNQNQSEKIFSNYTDFIRNIFQPFVVAEFGKVFCNLLFLYDPNEANIWLKVNPINIMHLF